MTAMAPSLRMHKRLLQFNQLVFKYGEISDTAYTASFKGESQSYTNNAHGAYYPTFGQFGKLQPTQFSVQIAIDFRSVNCEDTVQYARFIKRQLAQSGKLWATQNGGEVIWTNARVLSIGEDVDYQSSKNLLVLKVIFELFDGYWRQAKTTRTFICENYCINRFRDFDPYYCFDVGSLTGKCDETGASKCYPCLANLYKPPKIIGCYDPNTPYDAKNTISYHPLCYYSQRDLQHMFNEGCPNEYYIDYNCEAEESQFCIDGTWGSKFRLNANADVNYTIVSYCSKSDIPTEYVRLRLAGTFSNPRIRQLGQSFDPETIAPNNPAPDSAVIDWLQIGNADSAATRLTNFSGVITHGYGVKTYGSTNMKDPDGKKGTPLLDLTTSTARSNTPVFKIMPGINYFEITGNPYRSDSFFYIEPVEITY